MIVKKITCSKCGWSASRFMHSHFAVTDLFPCEEGAYNLCWHCAKKEDLR